jgi:cytochrome P450
MLPYGEAWRRGRKLLHAHVGPGVLSRYHSTQLAGAHRFVRDVLASEQDKDVLAQLIRTNSGQTIIKTMYGIDVEDNDSEFLSIPRKVLHALNEGGLPGRFLVDFLPICTCYLYLLRVSTQS